jgi:hypothetical protein
MAENKKKIVVYADWLVNFKDLSDEELGKLMRHFFEYVNDLNPTLEDRLLKIAWSPIEATLKRDLKKWKEFTNKQSVNGSLGGRPSKAKESEKTQAFSEEPKKAVSVSVSVSDSVNENDNKEDMSSKPDVGILVDKYLVWFNKLFERKFTSDTYKKLCTSKFKVLLKKYDNDVDKFSQDLLKVGNTVKSDTYHIETKYKHVTPEFILRPDKFEKFLNVSFLEDKNRIEKWKTPSDIFMCMDWIKRIPKPPDYETQTAAYEMFMYEWRISELMRYQFDRCGAHSNLSEYED